MFGKRLVLAAALVLSLCAPAAAQPFLQLSAWTNVAHTTRYPAAGTFDVSDFPYVGGVIGLNPLGDVSHGVATFFWTSDASGLNIVGVQGMNLSSLIVSLNQLRLPNLGPYLYLTYQPVLGSNPVSATLFGVKSGMPLPEWPGDTILIDERDQPLAPHADTTWYPDDYFAGPVRLYLAAPEGVTVTVYGADLLDQFWPLDALTNGSLTTIAPMGTWLVVVSNSTSGSVTYTVSATPLVAGVIPK